VKYFAALLNAQRADRAAASHPQTARRNLDNLPVARLLVSLSALTPADAG
jgi:hypothetical protein